MGSVNSKVSEDEAYLDLAGSCSGLSLACARLHLSSGQVQEDDHSRSWRVCRLFHPGCRLYGKNVKCVVKFKKAKKAKCELNFSCSAFTLTAKNSNCNRGSDFLKIGKEKFCEDNSPDVTVAGRTLNVLFRSNKRSKGGEGAECEATCVDPDDEA